MKIEDLTVGEAKQLANLFSKETAANITAASAASGKEFHGNCIVVLDKGFVYLGDLYTDGNWLYINNAKNIRKWTGGHGLSWYAENGFSEDIVLDGSGDIKAPIGGLKHLIRCR